MNIRLRRRSVFVRLTLSYVMFVIVFVTITSGIVLYYRKYSLDAEVSRLNNESLDQYARLVNTALVSDVERVMIGLTVYTTSSVLQLLSRSYNDGTLSTGESFDIYLALLANQTQAPVDGIHVYHPSSGLMISTTYGIRQKDSLSPLIEANVSWTELEDAENGRWLASRPFRYSAFGDERRHVTYVQAVRPRRVQDQLYIFALDVAEQHIRSSMLNEHQSRNDAYLLTDETGAIQFSVNNLLTDEAYEHVVDQFDDAGTHAFRVDFAGERYAVSGATLSNGWGLLRIVSLQEFFRVSDQLLLGIVVASVIFLVAGPVVAYFVSNHFYSPIALLEERVHSLAGSAVESTAANRDEFGRINSMLNHLDQELEDFYRERQESLPQLKGNFVRSAIFGTYISEETFTRDLQLIDQSTGGSYYSVVLVHLPTEKPTTRRSVAEMKLYQLRAIDEEGDRYSTYIAAELDESTIAAIRRSSDAAGSLSVAALARRLAARDGHAGAWVSFGRTYAKYDEIPRSYAEALLAAKHRFFKPDRTLFGPDILNENLAIDTAYFDRQGANLRRCLAEREFDEARDIVHESVSALATGDSSYMAKELSYNTLSQFVLNELFRLGSTFSSSEDLVASYRRVANVHDFLSWCGDVFEKLAEFYQDEKRLERVQIVETVQDYIQQNLADDLSLTRLSEVTRLSNGYLSKLFYQTTGTHINEYVQRVRMEQARDLLVDTRSKVGDIATQCGYPTPHYFSRVFKQYYGKTPQAYRYIVTAHTTRSG